MVGGKYWFTGVMLTPQGDDTWSIHLDFLDDGFGETASTEGTLRARYCVKAHEVGEHIDILVADAQKLGIEPHPSPEVSPTIYIAGDGEDEDIGYPAHWREFAIQQAERLGWRSVYKRHSEEASR